MSALKISIAAFGLTVVAASLTPPPLCDETAPPPAERRAPRSRGARGAPKEPTPAELFVAAANSGDLEKVKSMLAADPAMIGAKDEFDYTALHYAPTKEMAELLIASKADVNAAGYIGWTPMSHAASTGHTDVIALLVAQKADVNVKDMHGRTPADIAGEYEHADSVAFLKEHGGVVTRAAKAPAPSPAAAAAPSPIKTSDPVLDKMIKDAVQAGITLAAMKGNAKGVKDMIAQGADVNFVSNGSTPLCDAALAQQAGTVKLLLESGADPNLACGGGTPLSRAYGNDEITALLKAAGAK